MFVYVRHIYVCGYAYTCVKICIRIYRYGHMHQKLCSAWQALALSHSPGPLPQALWWGWRAPCSWCTDRGLVAIPQGGTDCNLLAWQARGITWSRTAQLSLEAGKSCLFQDLCWPQKCSIHVSMLNKLLAFGEEKIILSATWGCFFNVLWGIMCQFPPCLKVWTGLSLTYIHVGTH